MPKARRKTRSRSSSPPSPDWTSLVVEVSGDLRRLSHVVRFSSIPVAVQENTAEHSYWVALYSALIHFELGGSDGGLGPVLTHAIGHDLRECVAGDVVRTLKYETKELKQEVDRAEGLLADRLLGERSKSFLSCIGSAAADPYVKSVVKAADFLSLFQYMRRETLRGNLEIIPFFFRMCRDLRAMEEATDEREFPSTLYATMRKEAYHIARQCFRGLQNDNRFMRDI